MPKNKPLTYEQAKVIARQWYGDIVPMTDMVAQAIANRGGHCLGCSCKSKLTAVKPLTSSSPIRSENLSVRVDCEFDPYRKYPHRAENSHLEDCPSLKRQANLQARQVQQPQAA